jgi:hypothetical protein
MGWAEDRAVKIAAKWAKDLERKQRTTHVAEVLKNGAQPFFNKLAESIQHYVGEFNKARPDSGIQVRTIPNKSHGDQRIVSESGARVGAPCESDQRYFRRATDEPSERGV